MSGHSKFANIKHKKEKNDAAKGKIFTKIGRELAVAVKEGGGLQMPNMDGYKATQTIRRLADEKKACIPIIAMTANAFEEDRKKALAKGMNGHIAKPVDAEKLKKIILSALR